MVRPLGILVGLGFVASALWCFIWGVAAFVQDVPQRSAEAVFHQKPKEIHFASDGPFGKFDRQQLQRGFQVYKEVCSACHSLRLVAFRNLKDLGYSDAEVKAVASQWATQVPDLNPETGEPAGRKPTPADHFPSPYPNEIAARAANNNALPPDLSLITKAREDGPAYVYSILTGFQNQPAALLKQFPDAKTPPNLHYNPYFANLNIAMPPPLTSTGQVSFADGTKPTVDQMARDVAAFLVWTAEPRLENRHRAGFAILIFLVFATVLAFLAYRNIWADQH
jgi:ubiquinol-cytochrome c reductase cytochrome c1 subunit